MQQAHAVALPLASPYEGPLQLLYRWSPALLFAMAMALPTLASSMLESMFGIPYIRYQDLWFIYIPAAMILLPRIQEGAVRVPYFGYFAVLIVVALILESPLLFRAGQEPDYQLVWRQLNTYGFFVLFVNYGLDHASFRRVTRHALILIILYCALIVLGYVGVISSSAGVFDTSDGLSTLRRQSLLNVNWVSYLADIAGFLVVTRRYFSPITRRIDIVGDAAVLSFMALVLTMNASRGAAVIFVGLAIAYPVVVWLGSAERDRMLVLAGVPFILAALLSWGELQFLERLYVVQRFSEFDFERGRGLQLAATWQNFRDHPWIGVGYYNAAGGLVSYIRRSNIQYTQLLAAGGIPLFAAYMIYYFRMYAGGLAFLRHPIIFLSAFMTLTQIAVDRPPAYFSICAYVVFCILAGTAEPPETAAETIAVAPALTE